MAIRVIWVIIRSGVIQVMRIIKVIRIIRSEKYERAPGCRDSSSRLSCHPAISACSEHKKVTNFHPKGPDSHKQ